MSPRRRSVEKDALILDAAVDLFSERGYAAVSVPEVAERAGVGLGTLYLRFPSKEALGNAVYTWCKGRWAELTVDRITAARPEEQFAQYWSGLEELARVDRRVVRYLGRPVEHALDADSHALSARLGERTAAVVDAWVRSGAIEPVSIEVVAALIHGTFSAVVDLPVGDERRLALLHEARGRVWRALST